MPENGLKAIGRMIADASCNDHLDYGKTVRSNPGPGSEARQQTLHVRRGEHRGTEDGSHEEAPGTPLERGRLVKTAALTDYCER